MAKPSKNKDSAAPSKSKPPAGTRAGNSGPSCSPRLTKMTVMHAISQLGDIRGSTMQSIVAKLRRRVGGENITLVHVKKALDRLIDDGQIKKTKEDRFCAFKQTNGSSGQAQKRSQTKTASAAVGTSRPGVTLATLQLAGATTPKALVAKNRSSNATDVKPRGTKSAAAAVRHGGRTSSTATKSNTPREADRDAGSGPKPVKERLSESGKSGRVSAGKTDGSLMDNSLEARQMDADSVAVGSPDRGNATMAQLVC